MSKPHPLSSFVLQAFTAQRPAHDRPTIAAHLCGGHLRGRRAAAGNQAYYLVAEDVLGCLLELGLVRKDEIGWHLITEAGERFRDAPTPPPGPPLARAIPSPPGAES